MAAVRIADMIGLLANMLTILIFVTVLLSWFMPPDHPVRAALDRIVDPMLAPIRKIVPMAGMIDFSPMILMILIQVIANVLINLITSH